MARSTIAVAADNLRDALVELERQAGYVTETLWPRDRLAAAEDALRGELHQKLLLVTECAEELERAHADARAARDVGESVWPVKGGGER